MTTSLRYALVGTGAVTACVVLSWPFLAPISRWGVVGAALVALPVQIVSFSLLLRYRGRARAFLVAWVGGTLARMSVIAVVGLIAVRSDTQGAVPMLFALASFFFGLLLLEPIYFRGARGEMVGS